MVSRSYKSKLFLKAFISQVEKSSDVIHYTKFKIHNLKTSLKSKTVLKQYPSIITSKVQYTFKKNS